MARTSTKLSTGNQSFNQDDIERPFDKLTVQQLKKNVNILHLCADHGIELKRHGQTDYVGRCPFHEDEKPSFIVTPGKNLWHCMGCDKGGSVIDLVMELDGIDFKAAVEKLITSTGLVCTGSDIEKANSEAPSVPVERAAALLERTLAVYEKNFTQSPEGKAYLESRGITDAALFTKHRIGYSDGRLFHILPSSRRSLGEGGQHATDIREDLKAVGVLLDAKRERFTDCLVFPVIDPEGLITTLYGRHTRPGDKRHLFLPGRPTGLWNVGIVKTYSDIILVESAIDALSVEVAGYSNVVAVQGTNGLNDADAALLKSYGVQSVTLLLDGDDAGQKAAERLKKKLSSFSCRVVTLPDGHDPNSFLMKHGAEKLAQLIAGPESPQPAKPACPSSGPDTDRRAGRDGDQAQASGLAFTYGLRTYNVLGLEKGPRKLKATVRVEHAGKLHVDTLDFYSARSRRLLAQDLCRVFDEAPETVEADITRLLKQLETAEIPKADASQAPRPAMGAKDRIEAERFGQAPDLIDRILADFETCGLVGEDANKLLGYLAMTSRKRHKPLAMLILSSSGAGKTALQDAVCALCPPEDLVKVTSLSGKALFYKDATSLKHKVLAVEEDDGAEDASYALRNLISSGVLVSESTIKDLATGRLTTQENRVEGPTAVFMTTTNPMIDPETKSRFFVSGIDESPEQTRRILAFQRMLHMQGEAVDDPEVEAIVRRHHNFQRLLKPLTVRDPFGDQLTYADDRLQSRRDQPKYLALIESVAFLRQMQKDVRWHKVNGVSKPYIEVDDTDIVIANRLADEILGRSLDEISRPGRALLMLLDDMVEQIAERLKKESKGEHSPKRTAISFSRREIREHTGWTNYRVHTHIKELVELEYVIVEAGRNGMPFRYRLAYEGQGKDGEKFMLGLIDPDSLSKIRPGGKKRKNRKKKGDDGKSVRE